MQTQTHAVTVMQPAEGRSVWVLDHLYTIKLGSGETNGAFALWDGVIPPDSGPPPHIHHAEDELLYMVEGQVTAFSEAGATEVGPGGTVYIPKGTLHTFKNTGTTPARILAMVTPAGFERYLMAVGRPVLDPGEIPVVTQADIEKLLGAAADYHMSFELPAKET